MQRNWTLDRVMRYVLIAAAVAVTLVVLNYLSGVLFPFFAAFLIAYIMDPLVCRLQIKFRYRVIAVVVVLLGAAIIIGGCMYFFIPKVMHEVQYLAGHKSLSSTQIYLNPNVVKMKEKANLQ